jgi:hypothetical protein
VPWYARVGSGINLGFTKKAFYKLLLLDGGVGGGGRKDDLTSFFSWLDKNKKNHFSTAFKRLPPTATPDSSIRLCRPRSRLPLLLPPRPRRRPSRLPRLQLPPKHWRPARLHAEARVDC